VPEGKEENAETLFDRKAAMKTQCGFGEQGVCCRICSMGPCRVSPVPEKEYNGEFAELLQI
jgi:carbon-monoxide dehydrogenase catalytic subunit